MALSWKAGRPVSTERSDTIAERIEVCAPVPESVALLAALVDDMVLVDDADLLHAMDLAARTLGLLLEPSGAAGLAAIHVHSLPGARLATVLTGNNVRSGHLATLIAASREALAEQASSVTSGVAGRHIAPAHSGRGRG